MKKRNLTKVLALTLCLTFALSTVALAKSVDSSNNTGVSVTLDDPLPRDGELPMK